jgi:hypothetical protein
MDNITVNRVTLYTVTINMQKYDSDYDLLHINSQCLYDSKWQQKLRLLVIEWVIVLSNEVIYV